MFIKDAINFLHLMEESLDITKLSKFFSIINDYKIDAEFTDDDVDTFNAYIRGNDYSSVIELFVSKKNISILVLKDIINLQYDSLWQLIMDESYKNWEHNGMSRAEFLNNLSDYERLAVMFGNFNYQVKNGGLSQWHKNGYSEDRDALYEFIKDSNFAYKKEFLDILDNFNDVINAIEKLDQNDDWYSEDCQTRINALKNYDSDYYRIKKIWDEYFEDYLIDNIPDEYMQIIYQLERNINV